jgi:hypothetical protein
MEVQQPFPHFEKMGSGLYNLTFSGIFPESSKK